jgi:WD40 repeat protein
LHSPRLFRVFISSTFSDFRVEREALQDVTFPRIRAHCESRGAHFQPVDLRWGISEEAGRRRDTMRICLDEVARSRRLSPRPNFLVLLGDRYGWRPLPSVVPLREAEVLFPLLDEEERRIALDAYRQDENPKPPVLRLREPDDPRMREVSEEALLASLERAAGRAALPAIDRLRYGASATHQEIALGVLAAPPNERVADHVFCYSRTIADLPADPNAGNAGSFADVRQGAWDHDARARLEALREELRTRLPGHVRDYRAGWNGGNVTTDHIERLCDDIERDLLTVIDRELEVADGMSPLAWEAEQHRAFAEHRGALLIGRERELRAIDDYVRAESPREPLILRGRGGSGKSALLARAWLDASRSDMRTVVRFVGATPDSADTRQLVDGIVRELASLATTTDQSPAPEADAEPARRLTTALADATRGGPILLFIDGADQLGGGADPVGEWVPLELPPGARVVVSTRPDRRTDSWTRQLDARSVLDVATLGTADGAAMLDALLTADERQLTPEQRQAVLAAFARDGLPLAIRLASDLALGWRSWDEPPVLAQDLHGLIRQVFDKLSRAEAHGRALVTRTASYVAAARFGLSETELLEALSADESVMGEFRARARHPWARAELPPIVWARLRADLEPWLAQRSADGLLLLRFFHREFDEVIQADLVLDGRERATHAALGAVLAVPSDPQLFRAAMRREPRVLRGLSEVPYQLANARDASGLVERLTDFGFAMAKCAVNRSDDLDEDWERARRLELPLDPVAEEWRAFVGERRSILARGDESWPAHRILLQLAAEHDAGGEVERAARTWLGAGNCDWLWLRARPRAAGERGRAPVRVIAHGAPVRAVVSMSDSELLVVSDGGTARLWSLTDWHSEVVRMGMASVSGALRLTSGEIVLWHTGDIQAVILEPDARRVRCTLGAYGPRPGGHWYGVSGAVELPGHRVLTWSLGRFHVWDVMTGVLLREWGIGPWERNPFTQSGWHSRHGALALSGGRLMLWHPGVAAGEAGAAAPSPAAPYDAERWAEERRSGALVSVDGELYSPGFENRSVDVWDVRDGDFRKISSWSVADLRGAIELENGRVLTWGYPELAQVRDPHDGSLIEELHDSVSSIASEGPQLAHNESIAGACQLDPGRVATWSGLSTKRNVGPRPARVWQLSSGEPVMSVGLPGWSVEGVLPLAETCVAVWAEGALAVHEVDASGAGGGGVVRLAGHAARIRGARSIAPEVVGEPAFVTWSDDGMLRIWRSGIPAPVGGEGVRHHGRVAGVLTEPAGECLTWGEDGRVMRWDLATGEGRVAADFGARLKRGVRLGDTRVAVYGDTDRGGSHLAIISGDEREPAVGFDDLPIRVERAFPLRDGSLVLWGVGQNGGQIIRLDSNGSPTVSIAMPAPDSVMSEDGLVEIERDRVIVFGGRYPNRSAAPVVVDFRLGSVWEFPMPDYVFVNGLLPLRDRSRVLTWNNYNRPFHLWRFDRGLERELPAPELMRRVRGMRELQGGRILVFGGAQMLIWRLDPWECELALTGHSDAIDDVCVAADGRLVSWTGAGEIIVWDVERGTGAVPTLDDLQSLLSDWPAHLFQGRGRAVTAARLQPPWSGPVWHADAVPVVHALLDDGRLVVTDAAGRVTFPSFTRGDVPVGRGEAISLMQVGADVRRVEFSNAVAMTVAPFASPTPAEGGDLVYCTACGKKRQADPQRCPQCGRTVSSNSNVPSSVTMKVCRSCGASNAMSAAFCWRCGVAFG